MFTPLRRRHQALFLTSLMTGISAASCSKAADRQPSTESAATATADHSMSDSSSRQADTTTVARSEASVSPAAEAPKPAAKPASVDTPAKPAQPRPLPKPNIDPGRKPVTKPADTSTAAAVPAPAGQSQWLKYDAASNTVTFELIAGPFNFNGYTNGGATLTLIPKANVIINFVNKDGTPHSAEVISGDGPIPNAAVDPAIPRAYTNKVLEGLPQEATDNMQFTVPESGTYRIFCGVPGHGLSGMWIWMKVDPAAKAPSFGPTKS
jgi:sulfocyanin SoxE-like protein